MKIWLITTEYPPFFGGGIGTYVENAARMYAENGNDVSVFIADGSIEKDIDIEKINNVRIVRFKAGKKWIYSYLGYTAALSYDFCEIIRSFIIDEGKPDIIESQDYMGIAYFIIHKKMELEPDFEGIPIFLNLHTPKFITDDINQIPSFKFPEYWVGEMEKYCLLSADFIISPSKFLIDELKNRGLQIEDSRFEIIPNPYSSKKEFLENKNKDSDKLVFLGRVQYLKGIEILLENLSYWWDNGFNKAIEIIGGDTFFFPKNISYKDYLINKFNKYYKKDLIKFSGLLSKVEINKKLEDAKIVFVPSLFESFSYVTAEVLALGKIVVASKNGGQAELITHGVDGFLFSIDSRDSFNDAFSKALEITEIEKETLTTNAKKSMENLCSFDSVYPKKEAAWKKIIENKKTKTNLYKFVNPVEDKFKASQNNKLEKGLLSIIVPYYNMGEWVEDTLKSLENIQYTQKEIIIVNDGSTDEKSIAKLEYIEKAYSLKIINKKNGGLPSARNEGAKHAKGEFIAFLDSDDMVKPEYYSKAIRLLQYYENVSFVGCWISYFEGSDGKWIAWDPEPPYLLLHNTINSSGVIFKTEQFLSYGLNDSKMIYGMEDYESIVSMVENGCRGVVLTDFYFDYRVRKDSMSRQFNPNNQLYLYKILSNKHREFYNLYAYEIFNILNSNGPSYHYENPTLEIGIGDLKYKENIFNTADIPWELKEILKKFWKNKYFRMLAKLFFKLKLQNLFK